jgi:hypothetical protein
VAPPPADHSKRLVGFDVVDDECALAGDDGDVSALARCLDEVFQYWSRKLAKLTLVNRERLMNLH